MEPTAPREGASNAGGVGKDRGEVGVAAVPCQRVTSSRHTVPEAPREPQGTASALRAVPGWHTGPYAEWVPQLGVRNRAPQLPPHGRETRATGKAAGPPRGHPVGGSIDQGRPADRQDPHT